MPRNPDSILAASYFDLLTLPVILLMVAMVGIVAFWVFLRTKDGAPTGPRNPLKQPGESGRSLPPHPGNPDSVLEDERLTDSDLDLRDIMGKTPLPAPGDPNYIPTVAECEADERKDLRTGAVSWQKRGDIPHALACWERSGDHLEAGRLHKALGNTERAVEHLRQALQANPMDEALRIEVIQLLLDLDRVQDARQLVEAVSGVLAEKNASAAFHEKVARAFEAAERDAEAAEYYNRAVAENNALVSVLIRLRYLGEMSRMRDAAAGRPATQDPNNLMKAALETSSDIAPVSDLKRAPMKPLVGHIALGGPAADVHVYPVGSPVNRAIRFEVERLIGTTDTSATFFGADGILDLPVIMRIIALRKEDRDRLPEIDHRIRQIAHLSHPNLGRVTYVDRDDEVMRVIQEYIPGGNLRDFAGKLPAVGIPLLIRLCLQVAHGLEAIHRVGLLHGDVRLENVQLSHDQRLKLTDFLPIIQKKEGEDDTDPAVWVAGGKPPKPSGFDSDLIQFATMMDELVEIGKGRLAGTPAAGAGSDNEFGSELREIGARIRSSEISSAGKVRQSLEEALERFMAAVGAGRSRS